MRIHKLAVAISTALVMAPLTAIAGCEKDADNNVNCKSSGFNDNVLIGQEENINSINLELKGFTSFDNKGAVNKLSANGEGSGFDITNHGYLGSVDSQGPHSGYISFHNFSKVGAPGESSPLSLMSYNGSVSFNNDGDVEAQSLYLDGRRSVYFENNGTVYVQDTNLGAYAGSNGVPMTFKNTGNFISEQGFNVANSSGFSLVNSGTFTSGPEFRIFSAVENAPISLSNSGTFNSPISIWAGYSYTPVTIVNTGTISTLTNYGNTIEVQAIAPVEIYNAGTIQATDGDAISITGSDMSLYLADDWEINGRTIVQGTVQDDPGIRALGLTGDSDAFMDISRIRSESSEDGAEPDAIIGFTTLEKTGDSLWTLFGEQTSGGFTRATVDNGALLLSDATLRMAPVTGADDDYEFDDTTVPRHALYNNATLYTAGAATLNGGLVNRGAVFMNDGTSTRPVFNSLTVTGDYNGQKGSTLVFNTRLGNDRSPTDKLIIQGNTSGESSVIVNNLGGKGAKTVQGIKIITVGGQSDGEFRKAEDTRIVAGAYDYDVVKSDGQNWYLSSALPVAAKAMMLTSVTDTQPDAVTSSAAALAVPTTAVAGGYPQVWRPEAGSYAANLLAANTLFNTTLNDRSGESQYTDALSGEQKVTSLWLRHVGGHQRSQMSDGQNKTQANRYVMQLGGDVAQWSSNENDRYRLGIMAGYANQKSRTRSSVTDYSSRGQINGYTTGLYGTWYANNADKSGLYVDGWLQYSWFNNTVKGDSIASESYKSRGLTGSAETGYSVKLGETTTREGTVNSFWLQPQAQVTWMGVKAKSHTESGGTVVQNKGQDNVRARLGMKAYIQGHSTRDKDNGRTFQPYVAANWIYNSKKAGVNMDGESNVINGTKQMGELKLGVEGQLNRNLNLWGGVAQQVGGKGYSDSQAMLGVKYQF